MLQFSSSSINSHNNQNNILFIDSHVNNYQHLISGIENTEIVILESDRDGIEDITNVLKQTGDIDSVQIISPGNSKYLQIGGTDLSLDNLDNYQSHLQEWSKYLDEDADILLFGCQVGSNQELIKSLSEMTKADVAASIDYTGNQELNGDWELEIEIGEIESKLVIDETILESYESILTVPEVELSPESEVNEDYVNILSQYSTLDDMVAISSAIETNAIETNAYISEDWNNGYKLEVDLTADGNVDNWQLDFDFSQSIRSVYGVDLVNNGSGEYSINGLNGQANLTSGQSVKAIFIIDGNSSQASIPNFIMPESGISNLPATPIQPISETFTDNTIDTNAYISQDWNSGYKLEVDLTADENVENWQLDFDFSQSIRSVYGVDLVNNGSGEYSINGLNGQANLTSGQSVKAIFIIDGNSSQASIPNFIMSDSGMINLPAPPIQPISETSTDNTIDTNAYISQDWNSGYKLEVDLTADENVENWQLDFAFSQSIRSVFGVDLVNNGSGEYSINGINGQANLRSGQSVKAIFIIDGNSSQASIPNFIMSDSGISNLSELSQEPINSGNSVDSNLNLSPNVPPVSSTQKFTANNSLFNYDGRIDWSDPQAPALGNPGTSVEFNFTGTMLQIELLEDRWGSENYVDVYLDDNPEPITIKLRRDGGDPITYNIANNLENKVHKAVIYKRNDYVTGEFEFHGITINGQLLSPNPDSKRTIEIYGDSISSGIAVEYPFAGVSDPKGGNTHLSNAYHTYGSMIARHYDAEVSLVAQGGVPLLNGFGYWNNFWNNGTGAETVYDKVKPLHDAPTWDFNNYAADLVIVAYGQNDSATVGNKLSAQQWKNSYKQLIANLRAKHPEAYFVGMFPNMVHDPKWDRYVTEAIAEYRQEYNDNRVFSLINQQVTPGHPRISEQQLMADNLKEFIDGTLSPNGFHWGLAD